MKRPRASSAPSIVEVMERVFGDAYSGESWGPWRAVLKSAFNLPMTEEEFAFFQIVAGGRPLPAARCRELVICAARRAGKDAIASLVCAWFAMTFRPDGRVRPGERPLILLLAAGRAQSRSLLGYVRGLFEIPALKSLITRETQDGFELANGIDISVGTADFRTIRGRTVLLCIMNELAFWRDENSSNPDKEIYRAVRPAMASLGDQAMLMMISSVHRRGGLLYEKWEKSFGKDDPNTLVITASTRQLNPTIDQQIIDDALADDPQAAAAEYNSVWRDDLASYITLAEVQACVDSVTVRPPQLGIKYVGFIDASSGRSDSYCCAVASRDGDIGILHCIIEIPAPADPVQATATVSAVLRSYGIKEVWGDRYAVGFVSSELARHGLTLQHSGKSRSDLYRELLPALRSRRVRLLDNERAVSQFAALERRALPAGGERIDHPAYGGAKDDVSNAIAGALVMLAEPASSAENWIEVYRRMAEEPNRFNTDVDGIRPSGPEFGFTFDVRPEPLITIEVPPIIAAENRPINIQGTSYMARYREGRSFIETTREHAVKLLKGSQPWRELNAQVAANLISSGKERAQ
jgi:hypothetical protein